MWRDFGFRPYVPVALRLERARRAMEKRRRHGNPVSPVVARGRGIAGTFWGTSWCRNLERYGDYANRLPRGRTYLRNGSVVDLQVAPRCVTAFVAGSELYTVEINVSPLAARTWTSIRRDCTGGIDSLVALLRGDLDAAVMERVCREGTGLFPSPREIRFQCSCPDYASMCKHVAATLYGVGVRLDDEPELLFRLRDVSAAELAAAAPDAAALTGRRGSKGRVLAQSEVAAVFGLDLADGPHGAPKAANAAAPAKRRTVAADAATNGRRKVRALAADVPTGRPRKTAARGATRKPAEPTPRASPTERTRPAPRRSTGT